jgi:Holliday junction DNA helicase RuvA
MIAFIRGTVARIEQDHCILETSGVGYRIFCSENTLLRLRELVEEGERGVTLNTRLIHREDVLDLYGFLDREEQRLFNLLLTVSGIGPRQALKILGLSEAGNIVRAIVAGDATFLRTLSGIGEKKARHIILELQEKLRRTFTIEESGESAEARSDAVAALHKLGFSHLEANRAVERVLQAIGETDDVSALVEGALRYLAPE